MHSGKVHSRRPWKTYWFSERERWTPRNSMFLSCTSFVRLRVCWKFRYFLQICLNSFFARDEFQLSSTSNIFNKELSVYWKLRDYSFFFFFFFCSKLVENWLFIENFCQNNMLFESLLEVEIKLNSLLKSWTFVEIPLNWIDVATGKWNVEFIGNFQIVRVPLQFLSKEFHLRLEFKLRLAFW